MRNAEQCHFARQGKADSGRFLASVAEVNVLDVRVGVRRCHAGQFFYFGQGIIIQRRRPHVAVAFFRPDFYVVQKLKRAERRFDLLLHAQ